ncbi:hypothetical protein CsSME_00037033 [Camellia sinensis var. sinensis]
MSMFEAIPVTHELVRCWWVEPKFSVKLEELESGRRWSMVTGGLLRHRWPPRSSSSSPPRSWSFYLPRSRAARL